MDILTFVLDGRRYGLPVARVREIARLVALTPIPNAPATVEGVIDAHGEITPVYDVRRRFGIPPRPVGVDQFLIVLNATHRLVAIRVDDALDVVSAPSVDMNAAARFGASQGIQGVAAMPDGLTVIYDLDAFLTLAEEQQLERALLAQQS